MKQQGGVFYWLKIFMILAVIGAGFFYGEKVLASQSILINEIQIYPTEQRFIELYNPSDSAVDLTGWSVKRKTSSGKEYSLLAASRLEGKLILSKSFILLTNEEGYSGNVVPDVMWAKSNTIAKDNTIILYDNNQSVVDRVGFGLSVDCEGNNCALNPDENFSIQRKYQNNNFIDTDNNANDFEIQTCPSQKAQSATCQTAGDEETNNGNDTSTSTSTPEQTISGTATSTSANTSIEQKIKFGDLVINELVSDPADGEVEWVEIYNKSGEEIDLNGWWLEDGGGAKTKLSGTISVAGFEILEKPLGSLNNSGDLVALYDSGGKIIDQVAYGNWNDGDSGNNAPAASDPYSVARLFDGYNTYNNFNDFAVTIEPTKGASNVIQAEDEVSLEAKSKYDFSNDIYITEILPNPEGDDAAGEFIEIYNAGNRQVDLTGWSLSNEDGKKNNLEKIATSTKISAGEYLALYRVKTKIVLHNDSGEARLYQPLAEKALRVASYKNVKEGQGYNLAGDDEWVWSENITPGAANIFQAINHAPEVTFNIPAEVLIGQPIKFDSSDTFDADGDKLKYEWDFGDSIKNNLANPEHTYFKIGVYKVKLTVSDGQASTEKERSVKVVESLSKTILNTETTFSGSVIIKEILPNPTGADTGQEWIELFNQGAERMNLKDWRVENENGKYKFKEDLWLEAGEFYLLSNAESKLALKNGSDTVSLYNNENQPVSEVKYADAVQGESYALGANGKWFWTTEFTPGQENEISVAGSLSSLEYRTPDAKAANEYAETDLEKIKELAVGKLVIVKGVVAVLPGVLGAQIFYITAPPDELPSSWGIQVYNYKKDFPDLKVGAYVEISGELAQTQGELRLKTKSKDDIKILGRGGEPSALAVNCDQINEEMVGALVKISGEITDKKSSTLYLDDGNDEILIYIKQAAGISTKDLKAGQKAEITGIIGRTTSGIRLLPRSQNDIKLIESSEGGLEPKVLGEVAVSDEWQIAQRDKKIELLKYLIILAGGGIIVLGVLLFRAGRKKD